MKNHVLHADSLPPLPPDQTRPVGLSFYFASSRMKKVKLTPTPSATCYGLCSRLDHPSTSPDLLIRWKNCLSSNPGNAAKAIAFPAISRSETSFFPCFLTSVTGGSFLRLILFPLQLSLNTFSRRVIELMQFLFVISFSFRFFNDKFK